MKRFSAAIVAAVLFGISVPAVAIDNLRRVGRVTVTKEGGAGQIELHGDLGAVLQRDEGVVALLDLADPARPAVLGRYDDQAANSLDGDLAFSNDGRFLFYARQTDQFSKDGLHVLDVSDPKNPRLTDYEPQGGMLRVAYLKSGGDEWVVTLDATHGLVVHRFVSAAGVVVPVNVDALPALKVGGPGSAGVAIDPKDPKLGVPLLYVSTGRTGLQVFDFSNPIQPQLLGAWNEQGLADVDVRATKNTRTVVAATEHWFDASTPSTVIELDATELGSIKEVARTDLGYSAEDPWRIHGVELAGDVVYVAHSHAGMLALDLRSGLRLRAVVKDLGPPNDGALGETPHALDVEVGGGLVHVTDGAAGTVTILRP
jgi:hypothetical protein